MVYIPANVYPWITLEDFPERFVKVPQPLLKAQTDTKEKEIRAEDVYGWVKEKGLENLGNMFRVLEGLLRVPSNSDSEQTKERETVYALGTPHPTLLDVYIALVAHYAPRPR